MRKFNEKDIAAFIRKHYRQAGDWPGLENWVAWNIEQGFCLLAGDDNDAIVGLLLVRPVFEPCPSSLEFDPEGDTYFIDLCVALPPKRQTLQGLGFALLKRFGMRDKFAFQRQGVGPVIVTDAHAHRAKMLRTLNYGRK